MRIQLRKSDPAWRPMTFDGRRGDRLCDSCVEAIQRGEVRKPEKET